ncbi:MAG: transglycosylase SLT domain-containing protein [Desulfohalobiaceae bacterium]
MQLLAQNPAADRDLFLRAEKALRDRDRETFQELLEQLQDYPLQPYLIYQDLLQRISGDLAPEIRSFLKAQSNTPLAWQLREKWLFYLAEQKEWAMFAEDYKNLGQAELQCHQARALLATGKKQKSLDLTRDLWLHPESRPESCDFVFEYWQQKGGLDAKLFWQRAQKAMQAGNSSLLKSLLKGLTQEKRDLAKLWLRIKQHPELVLELDWSQVPEQIKEVALQTGLKALIRKDVQKAAQSWEGLKDKYDWTAQDFPGIEREIGLSLAFRAKSGAYSRLRGLPSAAQDNKTRTWLVRTALMQQDWQRVLQALSSLESKEKENHRWRYWLARALQETGQEQKSQAIYQELALGMDYYSLLAADRLDKDYQFKHESAQAEMEILLQLWDKPSLQRAVELYRLQRLPEARQEWNQALRSSGTDKYQAAAVLAKELDWPDRAIFAAASVPGFQDLEIRFPLSYQKQIQAHTLSLNLDQAWILALIRQESAFMQDASSSAGALGLMQIMPTTGQDIANRLGEKFSHPLQLLHPETNIRYGTFYLHKQLESFQGNLILASAAYNAGPGNVRRWLNSRGRLPSEIWLECIPYAETRKYVQRILSYTAVYESRLKRQPTRLSSRLESEIGPPGLADKNMQDQGLPLASGILTDFLPGMYAQSEIFIN